MKKVVKNTETVLDSDFLLDYIQDQADAKRALIIAIAGNHNILFYGPPGTGKTVLAKTAANLQTPLSEQEMLEINKIYGLINQEITRRPFRATHHSASTSAIIGGGNQLTPGEISLAHKGILFLDEFPEYTRSTIEALRQPIEEHCINISRAEYNFSFPADFQLIAAMNPCPCGYYGNNAGICRCGMQQIASYRRKISGPILDRFDMLLEVPNADQSVLFKTTTTSTQEHETARNLIKMARDRQILSRQNYNSRLRSHQIVSRLSLDSSARQILDLAASRYSLSARSYFNTIKVAQTIADLEQSDHILSAHITEALHYRNRKLLI